MRRHKYLKTFFDTGYDCCIVEKFKKIMAIILVMILFLEVIPVTKRISVFAAGTKIINLAAQVGDAYPTEFYFSNTKTLILSVALTQPVEANETIEININNYLLYDALTDTSALPYLTAAPTVTNLGTGGGLDLAKKITLKLKQGATGSFTMPITAHFNASNSYHGDTATINITQKQNGTVVGTPQDFTFSLYNDSKPDVYIGKSTSVVPGGSVTYSVFFRTGRKQRGESNYTYNSTNTGIRYSGTATIPLPTVGVDSVEIISPPSAIYDSVNNVIKITASGYTDTAVLQFKIKYSNSLTKGTSFTAGTPSFSGSTPVGRPLTDTDLKAPMAPISETVAAPPTPKVAFTLLNTNSNAFLIGENANTQYTVSEAVGKAPIFGFAFNNNTPYDFNNVEVDLPVPDGMKATGFKVPNNNNAAYLWPSTKLIQVEYTKNDDTVGTVNVVPNTTVQYFTATTLGLAPDEYIKSFKFKFDKMGSAELTYAHNSPTTVNFYMLGFIDTKYRDGSNIKDKDPLNIPGRMLKLDASYDADDTAGVNMVSLSNITKSTTYTTTEMASITGQVYLVNPETKAITSNSSFYPNDKGMFRVSLTASTAEYGNTASVKNPVLWFKVPDSFMIDTTGATTNSSYNPNPLSIASVTEVTGTNIPNGYKLYRLKTSGNLVINAPNNAGSSAATNANFYVPFTVNKFAPPIFYDTSFANAVCYIGSDEQTIAGYLATSVVDSYKFQGPSPTRNLLRIDAAAYNTIQSLNIIGSGFQMFHQIKSDYVGVFKPAYDSSDPSTIAKFTNTQATGTLQAQFANNDSQPVDSTSFVYYETLPAGVNATDAKVVLTGSESYTDATDAPIAGTGFKVLYSLAANPERNVLTGGTDTSYLDAAAIVDWSKVTAFKIITTQNIAGGTTVKINFPVRIDNPTAYETVAIGPESAYRVAIVGGAPLTSYEISRLAAVTIDTHAILSGKIFYDHDRTGTNDAVDEGINGVKVELYKVGSPDVVVATHTTKNGGLSPTDGYFEFINIDPGKYYLKITADGNYTFTTNSTNIFGNRSLTFTSDDINKKSIATTEKFDLVATNVVRDLNVGMVIHPKIVINPSVPSAGVVLEKVYDDKTDTEYNTYFRNLVTVMDPTVSMVDPQHITVDYGTFKDNMKKNGALGTYPIKLTYTNPDGDYVDVTVMAEILDTIAPTIRTTQEIYSFPVNAPAPSGSWEAYITNNFSIDNTQDDFIPSNLEIDFGSFDPSVVGSYTVTAHYIDPVGNVSLPNMVTINVQRTAPVITPKDPNLTTNGVTMEKGSDEVGDYEAFFKSLVNVTDIGYPDLTSDDLMVTGVEEIQAAMEKNGRLGNYTILLTADNSDGGTSSYALIVKVEDTTPAIIEVDNPNLEINENTSIPEGYNTWQEYVLDAAGIRIIDDQDDVINDLYSATSNHMKIGMGNFHPDVPGVYTITVDYTDASMLPNAAGNKSAQQTITLTVKGLPKIKGNNFTIERGKEIGTTKEDKIDYIKSIAAVQATDPMNAAMPMAEEVEGIDALDTKVVGDYAITFKYTNEVGETSFPLTVTVTDTIKPVITLTPAVFLRIGAQVPSPLAYVVSATDADASGNVADLSADVTYQRYDADGMEVDEISTESIGTYTIEYSLNDGNGNAADTKKLGVVVVENTYKVRWVPNNGENDILYDVQAGGIINEISNITKKDYDLVGWYEDENLLTPVEFPINNVNTNSIFYAKWIKRNKVLWVKNNGEEDLEYIVPSGQLIQEVPNITRPDYDFGGWYEDASFLKPASFPMSNVYTDKVFYAKWIPQNKKNKFEEGFRSGDEISSDPAESNDTTKVEEIVKPNEVPNTIEETKSKGSTNPIENEETKTKQYTLATFEKPEEIFMDGELIPLSGLVYNGPYTKGYEDKTIRPNGQLTRAEAAQMIYNLYGKPDDFVDVESNLPYKDVNSDAWYAKAVAFLTQYKVISGYPDGTFAPNRFITRAELVTLLGKYGNIPAEIENETIFLDISNHWAKPQINAAYEDHFVTGYPDNTFKPNYTITRAEAVVIINNMLKRPDKWIGENEYTDLDTDNWAFRQLMNAVNGYVEE